MELASTSGSVQRTSSLSEETKGSMSKANKSTGGKTKGYSKTEETTEEAEEMDS